MDQEQGKPGGGAGAKAGGMPRWGWWALGTVALIAAIGEIDPPAEKAARAKAAATAPAASAPAQIPAKLAGDVVARCAAALAELGTLGVIRDRPSPTRIDVDEALWARLPYKTKDQALQALACEAFQLPMPPEGKWVTAYGFRDGQRKAMLTSNGIS